jgi:hypothetical protein
MSSEMQDDDAGKRMPPNASDPSTPDSNAPDMDAPWANDLQRQDETLRLQEEVIAAARQLERQSEGLAFLERPPLHLQTARPKFELAKLRPAENRFSLQESPRGLWAPSLDPVSIPLPPQEKISLASPGMLVGLVGAVGVAAAAALFVVHAMQVRPSSPVVSMSAESSDVGRSRSFAAVADNLPRLAAAETKVQPGELAAAATASVLAAVPPTSAIAKPSIMTPPPSPTVAAATAKVEPAQPEATKPEVTKPEALKPASPVIPEARPADSLSRDEIASLLKRGQDMLTAGDIASARLFLTRAALAGNADASLALAGTFDAAVLANLRAVGVQPDPAKAHAWYSRAAEQGSQEAKRRLQQSALR